MSYGSIKVDTITYTSGGTDATSSVSGLASAVNGTFPNVTVTGTISGTTITGDTVQVDTLTGNTIQITSVTGVSGVFTTQVSGATVTGDSGQFDALTGNTAGFTTVTGTTITGTTVNADYGNFSSNVTGVVIVGTTTVSGATVTGGVIGVGTNVTFSDGSTQTTAAAANGATTTGVQTFTAAQRGEVDVVAYATGIQLDLSSGNNFQISLTGNTTLQNPTNIASGQAGAIYIIQASSGNTMAFGSYWNYPGGSGSVPSLTATSGATDLLVYYTTSTTGIAYRLVQDVKA